MLDDDAFMGEIPEDEVDEPPAHRIDGFLEIALEVDPGMEMPGFIASPVIPVAAAEPAPEQPDAVSVGLEERGEELPADETGIVPTLGGPPGGFIHSVGHEGLARAGDEREKQEIKGKEKTAFELHYGQIFLGGYFYPEGTVLSKAGYLFCGREYLLMVAL